MFSEILKIIPRLEAGDLAKMESALTKRFGRISKKFGKGLVATLTGGGLAGLALGIIDKLLNPLKEVQDSIDRMLDASDNVVTNAKQFGTTAGKLFKLTQLGVSTGLDPENLYMLIGKFQTAIAEAKADPTKETSVRKFVDNPDTAEAFFQFIQGLQRLDRDQQTLVQQEVFGEKQILKMADFLQTDFAKQLSIMQAAPAEAYTPRLEKLGDLKDLTDTLTAKRNLRDVFAKGDVINAGMIADRDRALRAEMDRENQRITAYKQLSAISEGSTKVLFLLEKGYIELLKIADKSANLSELVSKFSANRLLRGLLPGKDN